MYPHRNDDCTRPIARSPHPCACASGTPATDMMTRSALHRSSASAMRATTTKRYPVSRVASGSSAASAGAEEDAAARTDDRLMSARRVVVLLALGIHVDELSGTTTRRARRVGRTGPADVAVRPDLIREMHPPTLPTIDACRAANMVARDARCSTQRVIVPSSSDSASRCGGRSCM